MDNKNNKSSQDQHRKGLHQLYADDPIKADELVWNRETDKNSRRGFLKSSGLLAMAAAIGANIPLVSVFIGLIILIVSIT